MNEQDSTFDQPVAWRPTADVIERAQLTKFIKQVGARDFDDVYQKSIENVERFTEEILKFLDIQFNPPYEKLLDLSDGIQFPHWCVGGGLNITEICLDRWQTDEMKEQPAVIWEGEEGETRILTYAELMREVECCASGLRANNLDKGDAIGIHLPMIPETIIALLAINRIGAIAVPVFSGYGANAIETRLNAVEAKALITCRSFPRRGKKVDAFSIAKQAVVNCPTIKHFIFVEDAEGISIEDLIPSVDCWLFHEILDIGEFGILDDEHWLGDKETQEVKEREAREKAENLRYVEKTNAEDPLIILYTSGTTGRPKGIAHTHCGFPIKAAQDMAFGTDVGRGTRISWVTDIGWMMGPWLIYGALINGATICIYDGAPDYPKADRMWEFCARHKVEILGISPTLIRALANCGDDLPKNHDLSALRAFASTGEPWNPAPWWWLFEKVGDSKLPIINYSGGTEISGGILMGNPLLPIKPCSFPAPCPGIAADVLDEHGNSVEAGKVGELAIREPWIGMARGFWRERERYLETYWSRFENIWVHGDWAMKDSDGHWFILGRSDDTLKVAGKRVGPAEVESLLVGHPLVAEAAVIGVPDELKGTAMVAFCVLNGEATANLEDELKNLVAEAQGKPLKPSHVLFVSALPKTRNAKVMRRVIRAAYLGEDAGDLSALENPQAVEEIRNAAK
ncbi:MAG: AMP-binding protein [Acidobacteriota bacterium]|nr:AMP-binding protein [Acidobacteriota bacterium]